EGRADRARAHRGDRHRPRAVPDRSARSLPRSARRETDQGSRHAVAHRRRRRLRDPVATHGGCVMRKPLRAPWKIALIAFGLTILAVIVAMVPLTYFMPDRVDPEKVGEGIGQLTFWVALGIGLVAWGIQRKRCERARD